MLFVEVLQKSKTTKDMQVSRLTLAKRSVTKHN